MKTTIEHDPHLFPVFAPLRTRFADASHTLSPVHTLLLVRWECAHLTRSASASASSHPRRLHGDLKFILHDDFAPNEALLEVPPRLVVVKVHVERENV